MFCTGGIRCVKVGSYVKQKLGFNNVTRLSGGVVNYTRHLAERDASKVSRFRGVNYVFDERMGERITDVAVSAGPLDSRSAEALARANQIGRDDDEIEAYAERLSDAEPVSFEG